MINTHAGNTPLKLNDAKQNEKKKVQRSSARDSVSINYKVLSLSSCPVILTIFDLIASNNVHISPWDMRDRAADTPNPRYNFVIPLLDILLKMCHGASLGASARAFR